MLLILLLPSGPLTITSVVPRPDAGTVPRPVDPAGATVQRPGNGDIVERPDAHTGAVPWSR
jgi:hypothetical protein